MKKMVKENLISKFFFVKIELFVQKLDPDLIRTLNKIRPFWPHFKTEAYRRILSSKSWSKAKELHPGTSDWGNYPWKYFWIISELGLSPVKMVLCNTKILFQAINQRNCSRWRCQIRPIFDKACSHFLWFYFSDQQWVWFGHLQLLFPL